MSHAYTVGSGQPILFFLSPQTRSSSVFKITSSIPTVERQYSISTRWCNTTSQPNWHGVKIETIGHREGSKRACAQGIPTASSQGSCNGPIVEEPLLKFGAPISCSSHLTEVIHGIRRLLALVGNHHPMGVVHDFLSVASSECAERYFKCLYCEALLAFAKSPRARKLK